MNADGPGGDSKRLTLFCQVFYPDEQSTAQLFSDWAAGLAARGWDIRVVCGFPPKQSGSPSREIWRGVGIRRVGAKLDFKGVFAFRAIHYAAYLIGSAVELLLDPSRMALVVTNPPFLPIWAAVFRGFRCGRFAIEIQDLYPDGLIEVGILREGILAGIWRRLNRWAFRRAEFIIVLGRDMAERLQLAYGVPRKKIRIYPHWSPVESEDVIPAEKTRLVRDLGFWDKFLVQYSGNMGLWHDLDQIIEAARILRRRSDIQFLMVGGGMRRNGAEALASSYGLENITWLDFRSKDELMDSLSASHVALISQRSGTEGVAVPCKLYGILASGRPTIAIVPDASEVARAVNEEKCGLVVRPGDAAGLAEAILSLASDSSRVEKMGCMARNAYQRLYTLEKALDRFETAYSPSPQ